MERFVTKNQVTRQHSQSERSRAAEKRAADAKINRTLLLVMTVLILLTALTAAGQASFLKNGNISISGGDYSELKDDAEIFAEAAALSTARETVYEEIKIEIPDYCPVNYAASSPIAMVYDKTDGAVLYAKNTDEKCSTASLSMLMTASAAMDIAPDGYQFVAGEEIDLVKEDAPTANISKCFAFNKKEISNGIVMKGASDISYTAAACLGRLLSEDNDISAEKAVSKFVDYMNVTAKNIGAANTHFANPDGYYDESNYTTAEDMMRIALFAMDHEEVAESAGKASASGKLASGQSYDWLNTNNTVIPESSLYNECITGLKIGSTNVSGYCAAISANVRGHEIVCIVMNSPSSDDRYLDVNNLLEITSSYLEEQGAYETEENAGSEESTETSAEILEG